MSATRPIRVLFTTPSLSAEDNVSGIATVVLGILQSNLPIESALFTAGKKDRQSRDLIWLTQQFGLPFAYWRRLKTFAPHILHLNAPLNALAIPRDLALLFLARLLPVRRLVHLHGGEFARHAPRSMLMRYLIRTMLHSAHTILALSESERQYVISLYKLPHHRVRVLPNAVAVQVFQAKPTTPPLRVLFVGRISEDKGIRHLCSAFSDMPRSIRAGVTLELCGAGPLADWAVATLQRALGQQFCFRGVLQGEEKTAAYRRSHVLLLPSLNEGLPMSLLEAMSHGTVPVATPVGSIASVIRDGHNGILIPPGQPLSIQEALKKAALMLAKGQLEPLANEARNTILQQHALSDYARALLRVYQSELQAL